LVINEANCWYLYPWSGVKNPLQYQCIPHSAPFQYCSFCPSDAQLSERWTSCRTVNNLGLLTHNADCY
jgi:hypothetical protein